MEEKIIELSGVSKRYQRREILTDVSLPIIRGRSVAFIGHNGAGKSTLLKLIAGLVNPTQGRVLHSKKLVFGYVPEHFPKTMLTARQYIGCMGRIQGMEKEAVQQRGRQWFEAFFMEDMADVPMKHLSKGTLQKVGVIQALLQKPDVLLLDEPLSGQDLDSQAVFIEQINRLRRHKMTIVMSCHEEYLYSQISDTVYEVKNGRLCERAHPQAASAPCDRLLFSKRGVPLPDLSAFDARVEKGGRQLKITLPSAQSRELLLLMLQNGWELREMNHADNA